MLKKGNVNGPNKTELYVDLEENSDMKQKNVDEIPWNFAKFLISKKSNVAKYYDPHFEPNAMLDDINEALA